MKLAMPMIDSVAFSTGLRTAAALLMGNSVLVYFGVLGSNLKDPDRIAASIFGIGFGVLLLTSIKKG